MVAVAIGILAGVVVRRTILAAAITVAGYLAVRLPLEFWGRPNFRTPLTTKTMPWPRRAGWSTMSSRSGSGRRQDGQVAPSPEPISYHPDDRFWDFQLIETAILVGITVVLLYHLAAGAGQEGGRYEVEGRRPPTTSACRPRTHPRSGPSAEFES